MIVWDRRALAGCLGILALGVAPRLLFALAFPTQPISDFRAVHDFAVAFRDQPPLAPGEHWRNFNPGAPMLLAPVLAVFPADTIAAARLATAIATGCLPLLPWVLCSGLGRSCSAASSPRTTGFCCRRSRWRRSPPAARHPQASARGRWRRG